MKRERRHPMALHFHRGRRHHSRCVIPAMSIISSLCAAALLFISVLIFFFPTPLVRPPFPTPHRHRLLLKSAGAAQTNAIGDDVFRVPSGGGRARHNLWTTKSSKFYHGCSNSSNKFAVEAVTYPDRYLMIATSGGLNQQRTGITDAVVAARILNATLVIPQLDQMSFWKDTSNFTEIFDVDWFISFLSKDVKIIKELPKNGGNVGSLRTMRVPRKCTPKCYETRVLPVLLKRHVVQLTKFDYRLANKLESDLQKLRCRVNYHALKFTDPIIEMGRKLTQRMREKSKHFIGLHLRFESDMLAFSGCYYGGGEKEKSELGAIRKRWKTLHTSNPDKERRRGKCPLTPEEVGLMLRALGFGNDVHIYVASGEVYGGEETLAPLKALFPNFHSKETLASKEELFPFSSFSSRMAALDFIVCDESDVFVTNNNGNMARMLSGRRRYFGHKPTIRPNAKKLYSLFLNHANMTWEAFASKVRTNQKGFMGEPNEVRPGRGEFYENPSTCICEDPKAKTNSGFHGKLKAGSSNVKDDENITDGESLDNHISDDELDLSELDYGDFGEQVSSNGTDLVYDPLIKFEDLELEEILSD